MKNYEFDYSKKQIVVSKSFLKEAGIIGSRTYNELSQIRRDYPGYSIVQREVNRKHEKKPYGRLTYKAMQEFIEAQEPEGVVPFVLTEFQRIQELSKSYNAKYAYVKKWFLERYGVDISIRQCQRLFRNLGYSRIRPQPYPSKGNDDTEERNAFKKTEPR